MNMQNILYTLLFLGYFYNVIFCYVWDISIFWLPFEVANYWVKKLDYPVTQ